MSERATTIAFFGLGNMGLPMARNLAATGHTVLGYDPAPTAAEAARAAGLHLAESAEDAARHASVVITMLPSGAHVLDLYQPGGGIIGTVPTGSLLIDCSTIDVADARTAHELATAAGLLAIDAPVSGGVVGATDATLTFMVGGDDAAASRAEPVLRAMGKRIVRCGQPGSGQAAKLCNNLILAASMIAVSEAFVLGESLGLDHQALFDVVSTSSGQCWAINTNCPVAGPVPSSPANRDFAGGFSTQLMLKDLRLAAAAGKYGHLDLPLSREALAIYEQLAVARPDRDFSVVIEEIRKRSTEGTSSG